MYQSSRAESNLCSVSYRNPSERRLRDVVGCARFFIPARRAATSSSLHVEELGGTKIETIWVLILVPPRGARVD